MFKSCVQIVYNFFALSMGQSYANSEIVSIGAPQIRVIFLYNPRVVKVDLQLTTKQNQYYKLAIDMFKACCITFVIKALFAGIFAPHQILRPASQLRLPSEKNQQQ